MLDKGEPASASGSIVMEFSAGGVSWLLKRPGSVPGPLSCEGSSSILSIRVLEIGEAALELIGTDCASVN